MGIDSGLPIVVRRGGGGGHYYRGAIKRGTAIIRGNTVLEVIEIFV